jgi:hypothetical protein
MGGSYFKFVEPCGDVGGYLPQMLEEAASELGNSHQFLAISTWRTSHHGELQNAIGFIKREMKREMLDRYQAQVNK